MAARLILALIFVFGTLVLVQTSSEAIALGQFGLPSAPGLSKNKIELVAQRKRKFSARQMCQKVYGEDPVRAYYKSNGGVVCFYYENFIGGIHDRRFGDPEKKNFNRKKK